MHKWQKKKKKKDISLSHYQFTSEISELRSWVHVIFKMNWLHCFLAYINLEIQSPLQHPPHPHASNDKNLTICAVFTGRKHIESHLLLCLLPVCFCVQGVKFGQCRRFSQAGREQQGETSRDRATQPQQLLSDCRQ